MCRRSEAFQNNVANDGPHMAIILYNNLWLHVQDASYTRGWLMGLANTQRKLPDVIIFGEYKAMWRPVTADFYTHQYSKLLRIEQNTDYPNFEAKKHFFPIFHNTRKPLKNFLLWVFK